MEKKVTDSKDSPKADEKIFSPELFCEYCSMIPQYSIDITKKDEIFLQHTCINNRIRSKNFQLIGRNNILTSNKCIYCQNNCRKICLKCEKYLCENCIKEHIEYNTKLNNLEENGENFKKEKLSYYCTNFERQFFCKKHLLVFSFLCPICKINLCINCKQYHHHINCQPFFEDKYEDINIENNDKLNNISKNLISLSEAFKNCYKSGRNHKYLSSNIIENYYLIKQINQIIAESLQNNKKHQNFTIISNYFCKYDECKYLLENNDQFIDNYEILIFYIQTGDLSAYRKAKDICEFYKKKNNLIIKSNILYKGSYIYSLSSFINISRNKFLSCAEMVNSYEIKLLSLNLIKVINSLNLKLNLVETNVEFLKQLNIKIHHKLDFELRRKVGNIIAKSMLESFYDKLDKIDFNKNIFYAVEEIEEKIKQSNKIIGPENIKKDYVRALNRNYINSLEMLSTNIKMKIENIQKNNSDIYKILEKKTQVKFLYSLNNDKDIKECILLTLFFIIRNNLGQEFNDSIHNRTVKINAQIKDSLQRMKKKSDNNEKLSEMKDKNKVDKISKSNNLQFFRTNITNQSNKKCQKFYEPINLVKKYYKVKKNFAFEGSITIPEILYSKFNEKNFDSFLDSFKEYLNNISKYYELRDNIQLEKAIDLYFKNEKVDILSEVHVFRQSKQLNLQLDDLKSQKEEEKSAIKYLNEIILNLEKNINIIKNYENEIYKYIQKYIEYFNVKKIFQLTKKSEGFDPYLIVKEFDLEKYIINDSLLDEAYFCYIVSLFFCYEGYVNYLSDIRQKIKDLDIKGLLERNAAKNELIEKLKLNLSNSIYEEDDEFEIIWNIMQKRNNFIKDDDFLNKRIGEYVAKTNKNAFLDDLKKLMESKNINHLNMDQNDPQNVIIDAFMKQNNLYLNIQKGLKI